MVPTSARQNEEGVSSLRETVLFKEGFEEDITTESAKGAFRRPSCPRDGLRGSSRGLARIRTILTATREKASRKVSKGGEP